MYFREYFCSFSSKSYYFYILGVSHLNPHFSFQVYSVVDEMFLAGEIRETSQTKVLKQLTMLSSLE